VPTKFRRAVRPPHSIDINSNPQKKVGSPELCALRPTIFLIHCTFVHRIQFSTLMANRASSFSVPNPEYPDSQSPSTHSQSDQWQEKQLYRAVDIAGGSCFVLLSSDFNIIFSPLYHRLPPLLEWWLQLV
jgi:hypothetical protein